GGAAEVAGAPAERVGRSGCGAAAGPLQERQHPADEGDADGADDARAFREVGAGVEHGPADRGGAGGASRRTAGPAARAQGRRAGASGGRVAEDRPAGAEGAGAAAVSAEAPPRGAEEPPAGAAGAVASAGE